MMTASLIGSYLIGQDATRIDSPTDNQDHIMVECLRPRSASPAITRRFLGHRKFTLTEIPMRYRLISYLVCMPLALGLVACKKDAPPPSLPPEVQVVDVIQKDTPIYSEWVGTLDGYVNAEIRPKIEGYLQKQLYLDGSYVRQGEVLFEIDPRQFQASLDQAMGIMARAEATLAKNRKDVERFTPLVAQRAVSQQELDNATASQNEAVAALDSAKANVTQARLNLAWTRVVSPIAGVVGIAKSQVGDLVNPQTIMTSVSQVDPIKVIFNISEKEYLRYADRIQQMPADSNREGILELVLDNGSLYPQKGKAIAFDRQVDIRTGTMTVKGAFPNPGNILRPGQYAKVRAAVATKKDALLVPQRAVNELQGSYQVGVVGADGKVEIRVVQPGERVGSSWVIEKGLNPGDKVIIEGFFRVKPGMPVTVKQAVPENSEAAAPASSSGGK
jgi:RND family efflux transporter MFP subunit